ncbi:helicase-associated domain-containing protein [Microbacterium sp. cx-59]|uniref:helicase-associated domain-containing protein n=1 Tax=Microbacterium sp. cx-59 TaxID=2891207 RepID=UPI001E2B9BB9|nr:helicase-associated domain-containing protein [Microbacterium sp. cx-59]MCC4908832.1 helicase-associated domain-containing protein [Microbacterium sp. cx-59]
MGDSSDERALATMLAASDDAALADLFAARRVPVPNPAHDFFDISAALLAENAIDKALIRLPGSLLRALADADDAGVAASDRPALNELALVDADGRPFHVVAARLRALQSAPLPTAHGPATEPEPSDERVTAAAGERAFSAVAALADVVVAALSAPLGRTGSGTVSVAERRRLVDDGAVADGDELDDLLALGADAGLLDDGERLWSATDDAAAWLSESTASRWAEVARSYAARLPSAVRTVDGGFLPPDAWPASYPLDPDWPARATALMRRGRRWGILTENGSEPAWTTALRRHGEPDIEALSAHLPPEVDRVYLQADLTAISPGPLVPAAEQRLRSMAVRETRAQATTYRFTAESLTAAVSAGETPDTIRAFLGELSLTGIPQPLDYLIETTASRHGLLRVSTDPASGRTVVRSADPQLLATIAVDQALRPVGLVHDGATLVSRASRDTVYWSLFDARYPVVAVGDDDGVQRLSRRSSRDMSTSADAAERYARLIQTLRLAHGPDADAAWLERELEQAVRGRTLIEVDVRLPDASTRTFVLEATGIGGGRLRGLDRAADVERTLPLKSIAGVRRA